MIQRQQRNYLRESALYGLLRLSEIPCLILATAIAVLMLSSCTTSTTKPPLDGQKNAFSLTTASTSISAASGTLTVQHRYPQCIIPSEKQENVDVTYFYGGGEAKDSKPTTGILPTLAIGILTLIGKIFWY